MNPLKELIKEAETAITEFMNLKSINNMEIVFSQPPEKKLGDFSFAAFPLAKSLRMPPTKIAEEMHIFMKDRLKNLSAQTAGPYLNFSYVKESLVKYTTEAIFTLGRNYGSGEKTGRKVIVEHTSANPNGPFHVGRARNPVIGDALARVMKFFGHDVVSEYYVNDMGLQMAVLKWGINNLSEEELLPCNVDKPDHRLVRYYQQANSKMESNPDTADEIRQILKQYESALSSGLPIPQEINLRELCETVLSGMKETLSKINVNIDSFFFESSLFSSGHVKSVISEVLSLSEKGFPVIRQGNVISLDLGPYGITGRNTVFVFTREDGTSLYTTRDIAYHKNKFKRADILVNILGEDHKHQAKILEIVLELLGEKSINLIPVFYSFVSLPEGKMSTRKGTIVYMDDLYEEAFYRALEEVKKRRDDLTENELCNIADAVAVGAIRFNISRVQTDKNIIFKWDEALNFEGYSSPYIQYACSRAHGILRKSDRLSEIMALSPSNIKLENIIEESEIELIKKLAEYPSIIEEVSEKRKLHALPNYLFELAKSFSDFYRDNQVIGSTCETERLFIVNTVKNVLSCGLEILGIKPLEQM